MAKRESHVAASLRVCYIENTSALLDVVSQENDILRTIALLILCTPHVASSCRNFKGISSPMYRWNFPRCVLKNANLHKSICLLPPLWGQDHILPVDAARQVP